VVLRRHAHGAGRLRRRLDGPAVAFFTALDHGVVEEALALWGGHVTQRRNGRGTSRFKYTARLERVAEILEDLLPHLRGYKRERADELLEYLSSP
jgi:hypothetical protein